MRRLLLLVFALVFAFVSITTATQIPGGQPQHAFNGRAHGFIPNLGQLANHNGKPVSHVLFSTEVNGQKLYTTEQGFTYVFTKQRDEENGLVVLDHYRMDMTLQNATIRRDSIEWMQRVGDHSYNFFYAHCPDGVTNVYEYGAVRIRNVYPGIHWFIQKTPEGLKYDFELEPGADVSLVKLSYTGASSLSIDDNGNLVVSNRFGEVSELKPVSFQNDLEVETSFRVLDDKTVGFKLDKYNHQEKLRIDPEMIWGTVFGGFLKDQFKALTHDKYGNLYTTGYSASPDFPTFDAGTYYTDTLTGPTSNQGSDVVIVKFNSAYALKWATYYGGVNTFGMESGFGLATDINANLYVTGTTNGIGFPTQDAGGYFDASLSGSSDGFLLKFDANGNRIFGTYIGGALEDRLYDIGIDASSNVYLCGYSLSADFPLQSNGSAYYDAAINGTDAVVLKFSNTGSMLWSTFLGGGNTDVGRSLSTDGTNVFVCGYTNASNFPVVNAGTFYNGSLNGGSGGSANDIFITKFNASGAQVWGTYYGGVSNDYGLYSALDPSGNLLVSGSTNSSGFPTQAYSPTGYLDNSLNSGATTKYDWFFLKFNNNGLRLWATYYGGANDDGGVVTNDDNYTNDQLQSDDCGNLYASFDTKSDDLAATNPLCASYVDNNLSGNGDCHIVKFTRRMKLHWSTYYGGSSNYDRGLALSLNRKNTLAVCGTTNETLGVPLYLKPGAYYNNSVDSLDTFLGAFEQPPFTHSVNYSLCTGPCTGSAAVTVNNACTVPGYTYLWNNGLTSSNATSLCTGNYQITITDTLNCVHDTANFSLTSGIQVEPLVNDVSCNFACTGSAQVSIPGAAGLTYQWSNGSTNSIVNGLCPNNYSVTVTAPGCGSDVASFSVVLPSPLIITLNSLEQETFTSCAGSCNTLATVVVTGGQTLADVTWSNGETGTVADSLCPGQSYVVTAADSMCYTTTMTVTTPPAPTMYAYTNVHEDCGCTSWVQLNVLYASSYTVLWSTGDSTNIVHNLCPGNYTVTITDAVCGTLVANVEVEAVQAPTGISFSMEIGACADPCDVSVNAAVSASGPVATPLDYDWTNPSGQPVFNFCIDSLYYLTVTDACGNSVSDSVWVTALPDLLGGNVNVLNHTCPGQCDGVMNVNAFNGTPPYTYVWSTGTSGNTAYNLCVGTAYSVSITDGCGDVKVINFVFPAASALTVSTGYSPACAASCNGTAYGYFNGGIQPYNYLWSTGEVTDQITNLCAGTWYTVTVTDACGNTASNGVTVQLAPPQTNTVTHSSVVCPLQCNGTANVNSFGGTPPLFYTWNTGAATQQVQNLCPGDTYTVVIFDPGCSLDTLSFVIPPNQIDAYLNSSVDNDCFYICTGSIDIGVSAGSPPFTYAWDNGVAVQDPSGLCEGTYTVLVTDPGCSVDSVSVFIPGPSPTEASVQIIDTLTCDDDCDASGIVTITGGVPPFNVLWSNGDIDTFTNTLCFAEQFVVVDDPGCYSDTLTFYINAYSDMQLNATAVSAAMCHDTCDGIGLVSASMGIPPYDYLWGSGETTTQVFNLCAGTNYVTVTDALGCVAMAPVVTEQPTTVVIDPSIVPSHCNNPDGYMSFVANGGTPPYSYMWNTGSTDSLITNLTPGTYTVTVVDAHQCVYSYALNFNGLYPVLTVSNDTAVLIGNVANLWVQGALSYDWSPSIALNCDTCPASLAAPFETVLYCVVGVDSFGCMDTACVLVEVNTNCSAARFPTAFTPNADGLNDVFRVVGECFDEYHLVIYNRWGQKVFESFDPRVGWDGTFNEEDSEMGVYGYYADVLNLLGQHVSTKGNVTLVR